MEKCDTAAISADANADEDVDLKYVIQKTPGINVPFCINQRVVYLKLGPLHKFKKIQNHLSELHSHNVLLT